MAWSWALPAGIENRLLLVRHGEPEAATRGRVYGRLDVSLSQRGEEQMKETAKWLEAAPLAAVYSSPQTRALESARLIAGRHSLEVRLDERLCEMDFGLFEGLSYDEVSARHPEIYRAWMNEPTEVEFPGGESFAQMKSRVLGAVVQLRRRHRTESVAIVAHGGVNRIVLAAALGLPDEAIFRLGQDYAGLNVIDYYETECVVQLLNGVVPC
jgi:alpha-ribazole phosphatase/probable phosphoglycerate mutase